MDKISYGQRSSYCDTIVKQYKIQSKGIMELVYSKGKEDKYGWFFRCSVEGRLRT